MDAIEYNEEKVRAIIVGEYGERRRCLYGDRMQTDVYLRRLRIQRTGRGVFIAYMLNSARLLVDMVESKKYGYFHATNKSRTSVACEGAVRLDKTQRKIAHVATAEYNLSKASRPLNSRLDKGRLIEAGVVSLPNWIDAVEHYMKIVE